MNYPTKRDSFSYVSVNSRTPKLAFFIGKECFQINEGMQTGQYAGLASENPEMAKSVLKRLFEMHHLLPDVIICDNHFSELEMESFLDFIKTKAEFNKIPFLVFVPEVGLKSQSIPSFQNGVDDIIFHYSSTIDIFEKINFLKKFKNLQSLKNEIPEVTRQPKTGLSFNLIFKRSIDILVASLLLILMSPLLLIIGILIKLESKGPVFYKSFRAGSGYKIFKFYKFRTMVLDADRKLEDLAHLNQYGTEDISNASKIFFKVANDPRITKIGSILRNTSLDELPQLFNVLLGDMSLVGNRPLPLYEAATLTTDEWAERFLAPAGLTGLWQISKRGNLEMSADERINLDIDYAQKHSLFYDIWIMLKTPSALFQKSNA